MRALPDRAGGGALAGSPATGGTLGPCPPFPLELTIFQVPAGASSFLLHDRHSKPLVIIAEGALLFTFPFLLLPSKVSVPPRLEVVETQCWGKRGERMRA